MAIRRPSCSAKTRRGGSPPIIAVVNSLMRKRRHKHETLRGLRREAITVGTVLAVVPLGVAVLRFRGWL
jgi:hypothetical protein